MPAMLPFRPSSSVPEGLFSLLLGAIGGALGGYLLSNDKLRTDLQRAKTPEAAAKLLGKHLQQDGSKIAKEAKELFGLIPKGESPPGQSPVSPQSSIPKPIHQALPYTRLTDPTERVMRKYGLA